MNEVVQGPAVLRLELSCLYCGHGCGEILVHSAGRPSYAEIRRAFESAPARSAPAWDAHGAPRCPRCRGALFIEQSERRVAAAR